MLIRTLHSSKRVVLSIAFAFALANSSPATATDMVQLATGHLDLEYEPVAGRISLRSKHGEALLRNATAAAIVPAGEALVSDRRYTRRHERADSPEPLLPGEQLIIFCEDQQGHLNLEYRITLLRDRAAAVFELTLINTSEREMLVRHAEPLRALLREEGGCFFGSDGEQERPIKALTHGYIYYDPGHLYDFGPQATEDFDSFWNAAFHLPESGRTLVAGYLENRDAEGHILANCRRADEAKGNVGFNLTARSLFAPHFVLKPGASVSSGRLLLALSPDPFSGLEYFAEVSGQLHDVKLNLTINGWSTWSGYYSDVTEQDVLQQARFIAREMKPYGMEWVQIDDGFQRAFGDWEGNDKFPHGMKWLADQIRELGLKPGLWVAPYAISAGTDVAENHPAWLLHDAEGKVQKIVEAHQGQAQYILDVTHPEARKWLFELFSTLTTDWGYDFIKTDFVEWTLLSAQRYHDQSASKARAYRLGAQTMREAMGPHRHLLDCGPGPEVVGLIDSMRIELDRPIPENPLWDQYAGHYNSTGPAVAKRYYFHNRTWINDADHLRLAQLTIPQAQAAVTITALSGGNMIAGDRLDTLDPERLDLIKKVFPAYGQAARPLDLFETTAPAVFAHEVRKPFGHWWLVGYFNWRDEPVTRDLDLARLGLDPRKSYLVYEFWSQRLLGNVSERIRLELPPASVHHLAIREKQGVPQVLSTDRHYTQGAVEFEEITWDAASKTLSGVALGKPGMTWMLTVYVPPQYQWLGKDAGASNLSDLSHEASLLRARVRFDTSDRTNWSLRFK